MSELALELNDGLELKLSLAGPGARSYAFLIDLHIRTFAALLWFGVGVWIFHAVESRELKALFDDMEKPFLFGVIVPTMAIYFLYHPVLESLMLGRTPGKLIAGVKLVDQFGRVPTLSQILMRNVFRLVDSMPGFYALGLIVCFVSAQRGRIGDLAAGTHLVHDTLRAKPRQLALKRLQNSSLSPADWELANALVERWRGLQPAQRQQILAPFFVRLAQPEWVTQAADAQLAQLRRLVG